MAVKGKLSPLELQEIAGEIRTVFSKDRPQCRLGHLEIAALSCKLNSVKSVWSSSFCRSALDKLYQEISDREGGMRTDSPVIQRPDCALGFAAGAAFAVSHRHGKKCVWCCLSDEDQVLGGVWEAAIRAAKLHLGNLRVFVVECAGGTELVADKYAACGWNVHFMDAANILEDSWHLSAHASENIPSVIITRAVEDDGKFTKISSHVRSSATAISAEFSFYSQMAGLFRGAAAVPGSSQKAVFMFSSPGSVDCISELHEKPEELIIVDCGPAGASAHNLAMGFRDAGGIPFVAHCGERGFSLSGGFAGGSLPAFRRQIECCCSARDAEMAVLRLCNLAEPWQITIVRS